MTKKRKKSFFLRPIAVMLFIAALVALFVFFIAWGTGALGNKDTDAAAEKTTDGGRTESDGAAASEQPDAERYVYLELNNADGLQSGPLAVYGADADFTNEEASGGLSGIYKYLFNSDGLQIASALDADITGDPEMLSALNDMLCGFYDETELRTILVKDAFSLDASGSCAADHYGGYSVDLGLYFVESDSFGKLSDSGDYSWIYENAYLYGFVLRYPENKTLLTGASASQTHFRYVGKAAAEVMQNDGLCLEEFNENIKSCSFEAPLSVTDGSGDSYLIYYVASSMGETTSVKLYARSDGTAFDYEASGNGGDGYIITAKIN